MTKGVKSGLRQITKSGINLGKVEFLDRRDQIRLLKFTLRMHKHKLIKSIVITAATPLPAD